MIKSWLRVGALAIAVASPLRAAEPIKEREVELFAAIASGEIEAEVIAPSAKQIFLRVDNKTTEMLKIQLPNSFAAVPVLGQFQPGFGGGAGIGQGVGGGGQGLGAPGFGGQGLGQGLGQGAGGQGAGGGSQGLGGGFNGGGNGGGANGAFGNNGGGQGNAFGNALGNQGNGNRNGFFRVPAGKVAKIAAQTVCLEHGKPDPNSKVKYRIVPLEQFADDPAIKSICQLLAAKSISQNVAQAAAWHVANGLSWEQLSQIDRVQSKYTGNIRFFTQEELETAQQVSVSSGQTLENQSAASSAPEGSKYSSSLKPQVSSLFRSLLP